MIEPLVLPPLRPAGVFFAGDRVVNFGQTAVVDGFDVRGLVVRCDVTGQRWHADPAKCAVLS